MTLPPLPNVASVLTLAMALVVAPATAQVMSDSNDPMGTLASPVDGPALLAHAGHADELPEVAVTGHYDNSVGSSDAASQGVINSQLLSTRPALRPAEVLEYIPGMIVTQHSGDGKANQYFLRGFNLDHGTDFATTVGGVPVNMPTHAHGQGYSDLNFLIPELVDRIAYRKGPYYAGTGDFSSAGSADILLRNNVESPFAQLTFGRHGYARLLSAASSSLTNGGSLLMAVEALHNNGPWESPENMRKLNALVRYSEGDTRNGLSATLMAYEGQWNSTDQVPQRALDSGLISRWGNIDPSDGGKTQRYSLSTDIVRSVGDGQVKASAYAMHYGLNLFSNFTYALDNPVNGDQFEQADRRNVFGASLSRLWVGKLAGFSMTNELGVALRHDRIRVGLFDSVDRQRTATTRDDSVRQTLAGLYAENGIIWRPWLRTVAGLRLDRLDYSVDSNLAANSGTGNASIASPKLSMILGPWDKTEFFVNWGRGYHSNDVRGALTRIQPATGGAVEPVPALVRTTGYEVGVRSEIVPKLQSSLALWRLDIGSELVFVGDAGTTQPSRPSNRTGVEFSNRYSPLSWLMFDADLAWSRAHYSDADPAGGNIPGAVSRVASVAVAIRDLGPWSASLAFRFLGARPLIEDASVKAPSTFLTNMRVGYRFSRRVDVAFDVFNVFDRKVNDIEYYYESRLRSEAAPVLDRHVHPAEPRTARLTLRVAI